MIITFIGHGSVVVNEELYSKVKSTILAVTENVEKVTFYCGGYGNFDKLCAKVCNEMKNFFKKSEVVFITPYLTSNNLANLSSVYDTSIYPPLENVPPRYAIVKRNEWMIGEADLVIAFIYRTYGGAYKALKFARMKGKPVINIAQK